MSSRPPLSPSSRPAEPAGLLATALLRRLTTLYPVTHPITATPVDPKWRISADEPHVCTPQITEKFCERKT